MTWITQQKLCTHTHILAQTRANDGTNKLRNRMNTNRTEKGKKKSGPIEKLCWIENECEKSKLYCMINSDAPLSLLCFFRFKKADPTRMKNFVWPCKTTKRIGQRVCAVCVCKHLTCQIGNSCRTIVGHKNQCQEYLSVFPSICHIIQCRTMLFSVNCFCGNWLFGGKWKTNSFRFFKCFNLKSFTMYLHALIREKLRIRQFQIRRGHSIA